MDAKESVRETVLTLEDLVSTASLGITVLGGEHGLSREVLWAHSCEMEDPEQWLGPHELLMTVGLCVPVEASAQVEFIGRLHDAGLAGLMIGDHKTAPPVSKAMLAEADRRRFPVLLAAAQTPYAVVARHVAAATSSSRILQVLKLSKLYQIAANAEDDSEALIRDLGALLRVGLRIEDSLTGLTVLEADVAQSPASGDSPRKYTLRGAHAVELWISEHPGELLDSFILVHLMKVLEVTVDRVLNAANHRAEASARTLAGLLARGFAAEAGDLLGPHQIADGFQMAALSAADGERLGRAIALRRLPVLVGPGRTSHLALVPCEIVNEVQQLVASLGVRLGVSSVFTDGRDVRAAAEEATRVFTAAQFSDRLWTEFEGSTIAVLSRSHREAGEIISGVLGPLAESTAAATKLRDTLFAYLRNDRRWQETAGELHIHRQTLSYRLNRIEGETGMSVTRSADLAAFWIAYQAWEATR